MKHRLAILDMNAGHPNQGMRCLRRLAGDFAERLEYDTFDVRAAGEVPGTDFDIYLCSGGPGSPLASHQEWETQFFGLLDELWDHNRRTDDPARRKYVFFICHSFQLAVRYFNAGRITARRSKSFGTYPVHSSNDGDVDWLFDGLPDPFQVADFRSYQVVQPNFQSLGALGAEVLAYEKIRSHVPYERAVMAIRWSEEWVGTQFHPEADPDGMLIYFEDEERKSIVIEEHGETKYHEMMADLADPQKIGLTHATVIPNFLRRSLDQLDGREELRRRAA